ncbi:MAG: hypothetical protein AB7P76_05080 [Candidatus Melainabacteria bacterium]
MRKKRWYDNEPTLSMAVSLLQNAPASHQEMTARYLLGVLERESILAQYQLDKNSVHFVFPFLKRARLNVHAWKLLEVMKKLPRNRQLELALGVINYIYMLDSGVSPDPETIMGWQPRPEDAEVLEPGPIGEGKHP